jgi:hypothetical protein
VIEEDPDSYVRERAVFTLAEVGQRESLPSLKRIASSDDDPNVRSAALANLQLVKEKYPQPKRGELQVDVAGSFQVGEVVTLRAVVVSFADLDGKLFVAVPPELELVSERPGWKGRLMERQSTGFTVDLRIKEEGRFVARVALTLSVDPYDYDQIDKLVVIDTDRREAFVESMER